MSGGVDSSVAAYLLKKQGYDVIGVTFQLYDFSRANRKAGKGGCCSLEDIDDAKSVCAKLGIPHYLFDTREHFQKHVIQYFASAYKSGLTPNPCVACNTFIKFDELSYYAKVVGAEVFATGHYVRVQKEKTRTHLKVAVDPSKDQSYFLLGVSQDHLSRCLFPIGELTKDEVRHLAAEAGLRVSSKPDSMEVCFVPENDYRKFLKENYEFGDQPGDFVDEAGHVVGRHPGIHHFTIGQRKGLATYGLHHHYVLEIDAVQRKIKVGLEHGLLSEGLQFQTHEPDYFKQFVGDVLQIKIRSRAEPISCTIRTVLEDRVTVQFHEPQRAVTPGQFAALYNYDHLLVGGGPIRTAVANFGSEFNERFRSTPKEAGCSL